MATEAIDLDKDAFMRLVTQEHLDVKGPSAGYLYAGKQGKTGWEVYRTPNNPWYLYTASKRNTQDNAGGGALTTRISIPAGVCARLVSALVYGVNSATTLVVNLQDEDSTVYGYLASIAAGALRNACLPSIGAAASTNANLMNSTGLCIPPGSYLVSTSAAAAQTESLNVEICLLMSAKVEPVWDTTGSVGTPNLGASTISEANTWQLVAMP